MSRLSKAATNYRTLTTLQPLNPKAWYGLARSYEGIAEASFAALQKELPPDALERHLAAGAAQVREELPELLSESLAQSVQLAPHPPPA